VGRGLGSYTAAGGLFDEQGLLVDQSARGFLSKFISAFDAWIKVHSPADGAEPVSETSSQAENDTSPCIALSTWRPA